MMKKYWAKQFVCACVTLHWSIVAITMNYRYILLRLGMPIFLFHNIFFYFIFFFFSCSATSSRTTIFSIYYISTLPANFHFLPLCISNFEFFIFFEFLFVSPQAGLSHCSIVSLAIAPLWFVRSSMSLMIQHWNSTTVTRAA